MNLAQAGIRGVFWNYITFYGSKVLVFISTIILARLLSKEDYGIAGYAFVVISFLDVVGDMGIGHALIYHRENPRTASTAFWLGLGVGMLSFGFALAVAPLAGSFFQDERAVAVTQVLGLTFPLTAIRRTHEMLLNKGLAFGSKVIPDTLQALSKGILSIVLAFLGFGAWSLIYGQVISLIIAAFAYWVVVAWRPTLEFDAEIARSLLAYGMHVVPGNVSGAIFLNADYFLIGRFLGAAALGVYTLAFRMPELLITYFCHVIAQVAFPVYTRVKDDTDALIHGYLLTTRYVTLVTIPIGLGLAISARPFVLVAFTERWIEAVPVLQGIAFYAMFHSLSHQAGNVYLARGQPGVWARLMMIQVVLLVPALMWAIVTYGSVTAVAWTHAGLASIVTTLYLVMIARNLNMPFVRIIQAMQPAITGGLIMTLVVFASLKLVETSSPVVQLSVAVVTGMLSYAGALWLLHRDVILNAGHTLRTTFRRR